jgi:hypothetical protein
MDKEPENAATHYCIFCDFKSSKQSNYDKHITTSKHKFRTKLTNNEPQNAGHFICKTCNKCYKARNSLWYHEQKCKPSPTNNQPTINPLDKDAIIIDLIKQNSELQTHVIELMKTGTHNTTTTTNSHNKTFNLQFFLNDTCKDAMNITDFVHNLQLKMGDFEQLGEVGFVNGISNIIVKNLKDMDITSRPIHCTDAKRDVLYVKDEDKWEKEPNNCPKVRTAIKNIAHKNSKLLNDYKAINPNYNNSSSKVSDKYNKLLIESLGGKGDNDYDKETKIIKNMSKEVLLDKQTTGE